MLRYITVRLFHGFIVIFLISLLTFVVMRMMPGDPVFLLMGEGRCASPKSRLKQYANAGA